MLKVVSVVTITKYSTLHCKLCEQKIGSLIIDFSEAFTI